MLEMLGELSKVQVKNYIPRWMKENLFNSVGWRTKRKIVVIESDDWGSIRMPSKEVYRKFFKAGVKVNKCPYCRFDSLASEEDLSMLFEALTCYKDKNGRHPSITANSVVANPDFDKIRESNFQKYRFEIFTETLKKYPNHENSFKLWKKGIKLGIFYPQFHGREHLNVARWMNALRSGLLETRLAFDRNLFGLSTTITSENRKSFLAALDFDTLEELENIRAILSEGLQIFKKIFGFPAKSFIAPNYTWPRDIERELYQHGVRYIQGQRVQIIPTFSRQKRKNAHHFIGQKNHYGQIYIVRNCQFEPSFQGGRDEVQSCLNQIKNAFFWSKPAVVTSHRVNYIGSIEPSNRDQNLIKLKHLLFLILKTWPDVEFFTTVQLGELICGKDE